MAAGGEGISYGVEADRALSLWVVIHRAFAALQKAAAVDIRSRGFNPTEWGVLEYLYHKGTQPLAQVGREVLITSGSVTYVIDKLETRGLIQRIPCTSDRRMIYAALTEKGRELVAREFPGHAETIRRLMAPLTAEEQELLKSLMKRLGLSAAGDLNPENGSARR